MKWTTVENIKKAERLTFTQRDVPSYRYMCRAGAAVARIATEVAQSINTRHILVLCGTGNNGGDGFIAAQCLAVDGFNVSAILCCVPAQLKGDARKAWEDMNAAHVPYTVLPAPDLWRLSPWFDPAVYPRKAVIVDALLGIGARGAPRGTLAAAITWINSTTDRCPVISVDVPSGLNADTGEPNATAVHADITVSFTRPKLGFASIHAREYLGHLRIEDVGIPNDLVDPLESETPDQVEMIAFPDLRHFLTAPRPIDSHKGNFGHVIIIGGSSHYPHAPILSGLAAYRSGAGLVTLAVPHASLSAAAMHVPESIIFERNETDTTFPADLLEALQKDTYTVAAIGPGLGQSPATRVLVQTLLEKTSSLRLVIDADGLTALAALKREGWAPDASAIRLALTPHPGEAATLLGVTTQDVQADRVGAVRAIAERYHAVTVLKGANTLVATPSGTVSMCLAGNPGMATAGTGDVLTGMIAGCVARGLGLEDAAQLGVFKHAHIGDAIVCAIGQEQLVASDILRELSRH